MTWRDEVRRCDVCTRRFLPKREGQRHCSTRCRNNAAQRSHRDKQTSTEAMTGKPLAPSPRRSDDKPSAPHPRHAAPVPAPSYGWGNPGDPPLQGDDYPLEYYDDGFPKLPACLDRRCKSGAEDQKRSAA